MKNVFFAFLALGLLQSAFADEQDFLDLGDIGEESVITVEKNIIFPSGNDEGYSYNIGEYETRQIGSGADTELKRGNFLAGCVVDLVDSSERVRKIPSGTQLIIDDIRFDDQSDMYIIKLKDSRFDSIQCESGFATSDHDGSPSILQKDLLNDDYTIEVEERMTLADFNLKMKGLLSIAPSDFLVLGANDSDRNIAADKDESGEENSTEQVSAAAQE